MKTDFKARYAAIRAKAPVAPAEFDAACDAFLSSMKWVVDDETRDSAARYFAKDWAVMKRTIARLG